MSKLVQFIFLAGGIALSLGVSYLLALVREPQALWLWHDILGVM